VQRKEESAIKHGPENAAKYFGLTIIFQRTVTTPLTLCLSPRVHSRQTSPLLRSHVDCLLAGDLTRWFEERNRKGRLR
jgi:hypothetical protein